MNFKLVLPFIIGVGLAGCGSGSRTGSDGAASLADTATTGAEAAAPPDAGNASEAGTSIDAPIATVEAGSEAAISPSDGSVDTAAAPFDGGIPIDSLLATLGEISPQQLHDALANKDFLLIDVHYPNAGSIPGTDARIAYDNIPALVQFIGPNLDTKVVLTCLMGGMSQQAGDTLVAPPYGYRNIWELTGGMTAWTAAGYPLVHLDGGL